MFDMSELTGVVLTTPVIFLYVLNRIKQKGGTMFAESTTKSG